MQICWKNLVNVVSNTTIILMYDELVPETFMINMAIFSKTVFCFPYETKTLFMYIILWFGNIWKMASNNSNVMFFELSQFIY